jgi:NAD(P)-dependent dehydrogenase (short-subunit alcohol dehydrogenase family)
MLSNKVVAITGAGRGIGREIALLAAREGARVLVNDLGVAQDGAGSDSGPADEVVREIVSSGGQAVANTADISDPEQAASIVADAVRVFGRLDGMVNNAGILRDRIFHKMSHHDWDQLIRINLNGYFYVSKAAALHFKEQGSGSFVHFTSTSGLIGNLGQANYAAAKMGVVGLSTSIALDMARLGVTSNCVAPFAWSRMTASIPAETEADRARIERLKGMSADKVAPLVVALLSDSARDISGQIFSVRKNEIFLLSLPRPIRSMHRSDGWTPESITTDLLPAFRPTLPKLQRSGDVFCWDPV